MDQDPLPPFAKPPGAPRMANASLPAASSSTSIPSTSTSTSSASIAPPPPFTAPTTAPVAAAAPNLVTAAATAPAPLPVVALAQPPPPFVHPAVHPPPVANAFFGLNPPLAPNPTWQQVLATMFGPAVVPIIPLPPQPAQPHHQVTLFHNTLFHDNVYPTPPPSPHDGLLGPL